jgi:hypothetical protein
MTTTEPKEKLPEADPCDTDATPLAPGVWVTESTGFAAVPPRAQSDLSEVCDEKEARKAEEKGKPEEPRIETYRER